MAERQHEVSRIEGLSDAVSGFALTLLVISLTTPTSQIHAVNGYMGGRAQSRVEGSL